MSLGTEYTEDEMWFNKVTKIQLGRGNVAKRWLDCWCGPTLFNVLFSDLFTIRERKNGVVEQFGTWRGDTW